jgi:hypothetical protein
MGPGTDREADPAIPGIFTGGVRRGIRVNSIKLLFGF